MKKMFGLVLVLLLCAALFFGCSASVPANYKVGEATISDPVENLDISWTSGKVTVEYHAENTIVLTEKAERGNLSENEKMIWALNDGTLKVEYSKPGLHISMPTKELIITLPEGVSFKTASIQATSAEISVPSMQAEKIDLGSTSGDIEAVVSAPQIKAGATSGDVKLTVSGATDTVTLGGTSGSLSLTVSTAENVSINTTSGGIGLQADQVKKAEAGSTSGNISFTVKAFESVKIGSTSGSVQAFLPAAPGFTAEISTTSGSVTAQLPLTKDGNRYSCGDGSGKVTIGTTSGNVTVAEAK